MEDFLDSIKRAVVDADGALGLSDGPAWAVLVGVRAQLDSMEAAVCALMIDARKEEQKDCLDHANESRSLKLMEDEDINR